MGTLNRIFAPALCGILSLPLIACQSGESGSTPSTDAPTGDTQSGNSGGSSDTDSGQTTPQGPTGTGSSEPKIAGLEERKSTLARATPEVTAQDKIALRDGNRDLSFELLRNSGKTPTQNTAVSAISMRAAFGMVHAMARGETQSEIATAMKLLSDPAKAQAGINDIDQTLMSRQLEKSSEQAAVILTTGNRMFVRKGMTPGPAFLDTLAKNYGAGIYETDFAGNAEGARTAINQWVSKNTFDRIPELFPRGTITPNVTWVLTNAMYFKAPWAKLMQPAQPIDFTLADGKKISADSVASDNIYGDYGTQPNFRWAQIPLRDRKLGAILILPEQGKYAQVEANMSAPVIEKMLAEKKSGEIFVTMPKFKIKTNTMDYTGYLKERMPKAFDGADFGAFGESGSPEPITFVYHSVFLAADEKGVEAAAATGVGSKEKGPNIEFTLNVDRPFMFLVYDNPSGLILFAGRVMNPTVE